MTLVTTTLHRLLILLHDVFTVNKAVPSKKDGPRRMARGGNESTLLIGNDRKCVSDNANDVVN